MLPASDSNQRPWYQEPWPWILMAGPILVIIAGIVTAWIALRHDDPVLDNYYKQGLTINRRLGKEQAAMKLGLQVDLLLSELQLRVLVRGKALTPGQLPEKLSLSLQHPTLSGRDQQLDLQQENAGVYLGRLRQPIHGRWKVILEDAEWQLNGFWNVDQSNAARLVAFASSRAP